MPQALAYVAEFIANVAVAAAEATGASEATAVAIADIAVTAAAVAGLAVLTNSLAPRTPSPEAQRQTFRQAIPPRRRGCGHARMGGPYLLDFAANGILHRVVAAADCPVNNIDQYWLHQDEVRVVGGVVQSLPNGAYDAADQRVKVEFTFGATGVPAFTDLTTDVGAQWPATSTGTGIFMARCRYVSPKLQYFTHDYPHGPDPQFNFAGDVDVFFDWRDGSQSIGDATTWLPSDNPVVILVNELWRHRDYDFTLDFTPTLSLLTAAANICDELVPVLNIFAKITQDAAVGDTAVHLKHVDGLVPGFTIYIAGQTFTVSGSPAGDGLGGYLVHLAGGSLAAGIATGAVASWQSDPGSPVTEKRYRAGGLWNADEDESATVRRLLDAMDGFMTRRGSDNAVVIMAGAYVAPTVILGGDELIDYTWQPFVENARAINALVPAFVSPAYDYTQVDTTPWRDDADIAARGVEQSQAFAPELVQSNSQVMRLAKAKMARLSSSVETFKFKASALRALGQRWIRLQAGLDELSDLEDVVLEIVGDYRIVDNGMSVVFNVIRATTNLYDWDYETEEGDGPSDAARPFFGPLAQPTISSVTPFSEVLGSGASGVRLTIDAVGPDRVDLNWSWRTKPSASSTWSDHTTNQTTGGTVTLTTGFVEVGAGLDVAVAYQTAVGTLSPWSATHTLTPAPPALDTSAAGLGALAVLDTVNGATIDNNSVATVHVVAGSISGYEFQDDTNVTVDSITEVAIISQAITTDGGRIGIRAAIYSSDGHSGSHIIRLYRDATKIAEIGYLQSTNQTHGWPLIYIDTPAVGTFTYEIRLLNFSGDSTIVIPFVSLELTEYKR